MLVSHENTRLPKYLFISLSNLKRGYLVTKGLRNRCFVISPIKNEKHVHLQLHVPVAERQKCKHCHKIFCVIDICHRCFPQNCFHWLFATKVVGIRVNIGGMSCTLCVHMYRLIFQKKTKRISSIHYVHFLTKNALLVLPPKLICNDILVGFFNNLVCILLMRKWTSQKGA